MKISARAMREIRLGVTVGTMVWDAFGRSRTGMRTLRADQPGLSRLTMRTARRVYARHYFAKDA